MARISVSKACRGSARRTLRIYLSAAKHARPSDGGDMRRHGDVSIEVLR